MTEERKGSLLGSEARGGDIAGGGFAFQDAHILYDIPKWLAKDGFTAMIREGLGDAEAEFFDPSNGTTLVLVEMKSARLSLAPFWNEIDRFLELDRTTDSYGRFELVSPEFAPDVASVIKQLERVRKASPFYEAAPGIQEESAAHFLDLCRERGGSEDLGAILLNKTGIRIGATDEDIAFARFQESLTTAFPITTEATQTQLRQAYHRLQGLILEGRGQRLSRSVLEATLWEGLPAELCPPLDRLRLHFEHEASERRGEDDFPGLRFRWARFFGGSERSFPPTEDWSELVDELEATREWIQRHNRPTRLQITGFRRLSPSFAVGAAFPEVAGFHLETDVGGDWWCTSTIPPAPGGFDWDVERHRPGEGEEVAVSVGLPRQVAEDVERHLSSLDEPLPHLALHFATNLPSDEIADRATAAAKTLIADFVQTCRAKRLHVFLATPAALALFLGHRMNAVGTVQCYEFAQDGGYRATCVLPRT